MTGDKNLHLLSRCGQVLSAARMKSSECNFTPSFPLHYMQLTIAKFDLGKFLMKWVAASLSKAKYNQVGWVSIDFLIRTKHFIGISPGFWYSKMDISHLSSAQLLVRRRVDVSSINQTNILSYWLFGNCRLAACNGINCTVYEYLYYIVFIRRNNG